MNAPSRRTIRGPLSVLVAALVSTVALTWALRLSVDRQERERFENQVEQTTDRIRGYLDSNVGLLRAGAGLFTANENTGAAAFRAFAERLALATNYPGVQGIGWTKRVLASEYDAFVLHMRDEVGPTFRIWPDLARPEFHAIVYLEPLDRRNLTAIGFDMFTEPTRRAAMERARDTGLPAATGRLTLVQEIDGDKQSGFVVYVPVYHGGGVPEAVDERRLRLSGFVFSPLRAGDLLAGTFRAKPSPGVSIEVFDGEVADEKPLHRSGLLVGEGGRPELTGTRVIEFAGRSWTIRYGAASEIELASGRNLVALALVFGIVVSFVLAAAKFQRSRAELDLRESEDRKSAILHSALDPIITIDHESKVVEWNPAAEATFGYTRAEAIGSSMAELIVPHVHREAHHRGLARYLATGHGPVLGRRIEITALRSDGVEFPVELAITPLRQGERMLFTAYLRDISVRKLAEERQSLLAEAGKILGSSLDYEETLAGVASLLVPLFTDWCSLDLVGEHGVERLAVAHREAANADILRELWRAYPPRDEDAFGLIKVLRTGNAEFHPIITEEILAGEVRDAEHLRMIRALRPRSAIIVPLIARGRTLGAMTLVTTEPSRHFVDEDVRLAMELGSRVALAVDNARLFSESQEAARRREEALDLHRTVEEQLTLLVEASGGLSTSLDLTSVLAAILNLSERLVAADAYGIWMYEAATGQCRVGIVSGLSEEYQQAAVREFTPASVVPESPIIAEDVLSSPALGGREHVYEREGIRSLLALPLRIRGEVKGTLVFYFRALHRFSEVEVRVATAISNLAASAIGTAELYGELKANDRRKDEFLAMLAHELRNPLGAVNNAVTVLKTSEKAATTEFAREVIQRQVKQLSRLIDDLLDVSRISTGKVRLKMEIVDARDVVNHAVESARALIAERRHDLQVFVDREPLPLRADPTRLEQIVVNLLTNSAKYTENGGRIRLTARSEGSHVVISVRDTGVGIPPEKLPEMFRLFAQGERSIARSEGGLGIGLTVVQKLTEMHGGTVEARSEGPGTGSEFTVRLPSSEQLLSADSASNREDGKVGFWTGLRILVVDDNVDMAQSTAILLQRYGNEVHVAHDGPSAVETALSVRPKFILLDIGLPGMDGYEVASRLRADDRCRGAIIIAVSGYGQEEDRQRSKAAGFNFHLIKPVEFDTLLTLFALSA